MNRIEPLFESREWIEEARREEVPHPASVAFVTVGANGKAREIEANPHVSLLFQSSPARASRSRTSNPCEHGLLTWRRSKEAAPDSPEVEPR